MVSHICQQQKLEEDLDDATTHFDMGALKASLPKKRKGLSMYYSGKSQSFTSLADAHCLEDLKKPEIHPAKKKKYSNRQRTQVLHQDPCRRISSCTPLAATFVGF
ncbi:hypothetical protein FRX31_006421 [Thalictrum thalictroides]|uniref:Uncharacterized protein n=1 Tax=Thalictrum thalictroides TaxID=46969 RepID=A0A7J6X2L5_THATH|nr:hypothetical protein FRX31_006421 [Thalictrum thalictroides]